VRRFARLVLCLSLSGSFALFSQTIVVPVTQPTLARHYEQGESLVYRMQGINEGQSTTRRYDAVAKGLVTKDASGNFVEQFHWSDVHSDGEAFTLSPESQQLQQTVSLDPGYRLAMPSLRTVQPVLIGPIADLLTFYAGCHRLRHLATVGRRGSAHGHTDCASRSSCGTSTQVAHCVDAQARRLQAEQLGTGGKDPGGEVYCRHWSRDL